MITLFVLEEETCRSSSASIFFAIFFFFFNFSTFSTSISLVVLRFLCLIFGPICDGNGLLVDFNFTAPSTGATTVGSNEEAIFLDFLRFDKSPPTTIFSSFVSLNNKTIIHSFDRFIKKRVITQRENFPTLMDGEKKIIH